jgi:hypothetical protein
MTEKLADILINLLEERIDNYYQDIKDVLAKTMTEKPIDSGVCKWKRTVFNADGFDQLAYLVPCINDDAYYALERDTLWKFCPFCGKRIKDVKP